jgi:signal transduction histidine kinase
MWKDAYQAALLLLAEAFVNPPRAPAIAPRIAGLLRGTVKVTATGRGWAVLTAQTAPRMITAAAVVGLAVRAGILPQGILLWLPLRRLVFIPVRRRFVVSAALSASALVLLAALVIVSQVSRPWAVYLLIACGLVGWLLAYRRHMEDGWFLTAGMEQIRTVRARLEEAGRQHLHYANIGSLLREADGQFRHITDVWAVYTHLGMFLHRLIPDTDGLVVWRLAEGGEQVLQPAYADGRYLTLIGADIRQPVWAGAVGRTFQTHLPYAVPDLARDPVLISYGTALYGSGLAVPMLTAEGPLGAAFVVRPTLGEWPDNQVWAASLLCGLAALRIQSLRTRQLMEGFTRLHDLVALGTEGEGPEEPLQRFAHHVFITSGADKYRILKVDPNGMPVDSGPLVQGLGQRLAGKCLEVTHFRGSAIGAELQSIGVTDAVSVPLIRGDGQVLAVVLLLYRFSPDARIDPDLLQMLNTYARYAGVAVHNAELFRTVQRQSVQLRQLVRRVVEAQEAERRRIALDLHDWGVQGMVAPSYQLQTALQLMAQTPHPGQAEIADALEQLQTAGDELRRIMKGLRPYLLDELGLTEALKAYTADWSRTTGIACQITADPGARLPAGSEEALMAFRIVQEALNNAAKHSGATRVQIAMVRQAGAMAIRISDDGCGLPETPPCRPGGIGLMGMQERASLVGGSLTVGNHPGRGCLVTCTIPVPHRD